MFYTLVSLPTVVITYRAVITPYRLPTFNPFVSLRVLLTPAERSRPWLIYLTPGLLATQLIHVAYVIFVLNVIGRKISGDNGWLEFDTQRRAMSTVWTLISALILTPLEVISTR
jgi:hypothetical protein